MEIGQSKCYLGHVIVVGIVSEIQITKENKVVKFAGVKTIEGVGLFWLNSFRFIAIGENLNEEHNCVSEIGLFGFSSVAGIGSGYIIINGFIIDRVSVFAKISRVYGMARGFASDSGIQLIHGKIIKRVGIEISASTQGHVDKVTSVEFEILLS